LSITDAIQLAQEKNEAALAQNVQPPPQELDSEALLLLRHWAEFCKARGIRACPARPASVAMFIRSENSLGVPVERILAALAAIEVMHNQAAESNPVACAMPRLELEKITNIEAPRTWPKVDRPLFQSLPPDVRAVIKRNADSTSLALRRLQNKVAAISQKGNCNADEKTD
jgi:hypothetical protein